MVSRLLPLLLILTIGCGREVKLADNKLESFSNITQAEETPLDQEGVLQRRTSSNPNDQVTTGGTSYKVSLYSSYLALEFIAARPMGSQQAIKFKGTTRGNEIVLSIVQVR